MSITGRVRFLWPGRRPIRATVRGGFPLHLFWHTAAGSPTPSNRPYPTPARHHRPFLCLGIIVAQHTAPSIASNDAHDTHGYSLLSPETTPTKQQWNFMRVMRFNARHLMRTAPFHRSPIPSKTRTCFPSLRGCVTVKPGTTARRSRLNRLIGGTKSLSC